MWGIRSVQLALPGGPVGAAQTLEAAEAVARREEEFAYYGQPAVGLEGLLNAKGHLRRAGGGTAPR